jgi:eukaryotic-like serine/threonine-protein kinase
MSNPTKPAVATDIFAVTPSAEGSETLNAPTRVAATPGGGNQPLRPGERFGDFVILRELGAGAFATVFLAHELTLDRRVALKVSESRGPGEGRALANLEHQSIVQVYAQFAEEARHCLCLQYVPGATVAHIIQRLYRDNKRPQHGAQILAALELTADEAIPFDPAGSRNREAIDSSGFAAAVCRIGAQMAEALEFAHRRGVLHCDLKPANVLINPYGRPLLADFNVAIEAQTSSSAKAVGGTVCYMAPEHLALFLHRSADQPVDVRSDLYSLGVVLFELLTGRLPFELGPDGRTSENLGDLLRRQRRFSGRDSWAPEQLPPVVERVLRRCLDPVPAGRYADAGELARSLSNAREILDAQRQLGDGGALTRWAGRRPLAALVALALAPQLAGSLVNIAYNAVEVRLNPRQSGVFAQMILGYNALIWPICVGILIRLLVPVSSGLRRFQESGALSGLQVDELRRRALRLGSWGIILALSGWLPGGLLFPLLLDAIAGDVGWRVYGHFFTSFALSGVIALIYSHFAVQFVCLRLIAPMVVNADSHPADVRAAELSRAARFFVPFQGLAAVVPLVGAVLLVAFSGEMTLSFRLLVAGLIILGMTGLGIALTVTRYLAVVVRICGTSR